MGTPKSKNKINITPFFSIIVPIYNVEKYLGRCLKSIENQTFCQYEVILIDDESPDMCPKICDEIANRDNRFSVIHKKNEGAGLARNSGLKAAKGEYVVFVDPDDYLAANALQGFYEILKKGSIDVCYGGVYSVLNSRINKEPFLYEAQTYRNKEILDKLLLRIVGKSAKERYPSIPMSVWRGIYKTSLLKKYNIRFLSERVVLSEDWLFTFDVLAKAATVRCEKHYFYYYTKDNAESLSRKYNPERFNVTRCYSLYRHFIYKASQIGYEKQYKERMQGIFLGNIIVCIKQAVLNRHNVTTKETLAALERIVRDKRVQKILSEYPYLHDTFLKKCIFLLIKKKMVIMIYAVTIMNDFIKGKG